MPIVSLNVPDKELDFFLKLVDKFNYKQTILDTVAIPKAIQEMVIDRKKTAKTKDYVKAKDSVQKLKKKYGF
jgi:hypothetical protein